MSQLIIDIGSGYNTNDGDKLRDGGEKINKNYSELWPRCVLWRSGEYVDLTQVLYQNTTYILSDTVALPFNSVNFPNELANGDWIKTSNDHIILYGKFHVYKAEGNLDLNALEIGDAIRGFWSTSLFWDMAVYNGGGSTNESSYTVYNYFNII